MKIEHKDKFILVTADEGFVLVTREEVDENYTSSKKMYCPLSYNLDNIKEIDIATDEANKKVVEEKMQELLNNSNYDIIEENQEQTDDIHL